MYDITCPRIGEHFNSLACIHWLLFFTAQCAKRIHSLGQINVEVVVVNFFLAPICCVNIRFYR